MNLADVKAKSVPITLQDGKERHLRFTLNALALLEEKYGSVDKAFEEVQKSNSVLGLRYILWAGLSWEDEELTEHDVGNLIDIGYMNDMIEKLGVALDDSMPVDPQASNVLAAKQAAAEQVREASGQAAKLNASDPN